MLIKYAEEKLSKVYKHSFIDFCKGFDSISDIAFTRKSVKGRANLVLCNLKQK